MVLSGNDGCVVSRSNEAKALGIKMGVPLYQIQGLVDKDGVVCFSSNFSLDGDLSDRVMSIIRQHTSRFEQYSIDECFSMSIISLLTNKKRTASNWLKIFDGE